MKLYHVSLDLDCNGQFTPRVPMSTLSGEDQNINRVCTAKTVEGFFSAMPCGPELLSGEYLNHGGNFKLFEIDTEKLGLLNIIDSDCLSKKSLVSDATLTGEVWILDNFEVPKKDTHIIWVRDWDEKKY